MVIWFLILEFFLTNLQPTKVKRLECPKSNNNLHSSKGRCSRWTSAIVAVISQNRYQFLLKEQFGTHPSDPAPSSLAFVLLKVFNLPNKYETSIILAIFYSIWSPKIFSSGKQKLIAFFPFIYRSTEMMSKLFYPIYLSARTRH